MSIYIYIYTHDTVERNGRKACKGMFSRGSMLSAGFHWSPLAPRYLEVFSPALKNLPASSVNMQLLWLDLLLATPRPGSLIKDCNCLLML